MLTFQLKVILISVTCSGIYGQEGFTKHIPFPERQPNLLYGISFANDSVGLAVGANRVIYTTTNAGTTWIDRSWTQGEYWSLMQVKVFGSGVAYIAGERVFKSINGGVSWDTGSTCTKDGYPIYSMSALNSNHVWAVGSGGIICHTIDGGGTWTQSYTDLYQERFSDLYAVDFIDTAHGYAGGTSGLFMKTTNMGASWAYYYTRLQYTFRSIKFVSKELGFAAGQMQYMNNNMVYSHYGILKTKDGGASWELTNSGVGHLHDVKVNSNGVGLAVGSEGLIFRTSNWGESWEKLNDITDLNLYRIEFTGNRSAYIVGDSGSIWRYSYIPSFANQKKVRRKATSIGQEKFDLLGKKVLKSRYGPNINYDIFK